jgi:hypothetical protein
MLVTLMVLPFFWPETKDAKAAFPARGDPYVYMSVAMSALRKYAPAKVATAPPSE